MYVEMQRAKTNHNNLEPRLIKLETYMTRYQEFLWNYSNDDREVLEKTNRQWKRTECRNWFTCTQTKNRTGSPKTSINFHTFAFHLWQRWQCRAMKNNGLFRQWCWLKPDCVQANKVISNMYILKNFTSHCSLWERYWRISYHGGCILRQRKTEIQKIPMQKCRKEIPGAEATTAGPEHEFGLTGVEGTPGKTQGGMPWISA